MFLTNMSLELTISQDALVTFIDGAKDLLEKAIREAQMAMTYRLYDIVQNNFGEAGEDRPEEWVALSPAYARRVGRPHATLEVSGKLRYSIQVDGEGPEGGRVWVDPDAVPYALAHQFGSGNIPARPYFPMDENGQLTEYSQTSVLEAGRAALEEALK